MPKVSRKYYRRAKESTASDINIIETFINTPSLHSNNIFLCQNIKGSENSNNKNQCSNISVDTHYSQQIDDDVNDYNFESEAVNNSNSNNNDINKDIYKYIKNDLLENVTDNSLQFLSWFRRWAVKYNISHVALNELMAGIKPYCPQLPKDARTLLRTIRKVNAEGEPKNYYHFGLRNCIENLLSRQSFINLSIIEVYINIDGLPLFKSSSSEVYPILCSIISNCSEVGVVGIYNGNQKPPDANIFLQSFVKEARDLTINGIEIKGQIYPFKIRAFICDVPATSFIKYTKGHTGYNSCNKCTVKGEYFLDRVCYPYFNYFHLRTDNEFRQKLDKHHHTGTSILETIPNIDMVNDFPSDPMHLLYLGVVKKLVNLWCKGKPKTKLSYHQISEISKLLIDESCNIPCEFNRKSRTLLEYKRWKATEFRTFLFYTGPVVLKSVLKTDKYLNFLSLHVAVTILSNSMHMEQYIEYAKLLMQYFVKTFIILYGKENASHNIHNLLHLSNEAEKFGTLQEFSAFPFENYLQSILKLIRKNDKPLEQIVRRISEHNFCLNTKFNMRSNNEPELLNPHFNGPLVNHQNCKQFSKVKFKNFMLKTREPDNCCCLNDGTIIVIKNFASNIEGTIVIGHKYRSLQDFYSEPCKSSTFGIYVVDNIGHLQNWNLGQIAYKCLKLKLKDKHIVFPLMHSK